jgi:hypothetical protein
MLLSSALGKLCSLVIVAGQAVTWQPERHARWTPSKLQFSNGFQDMTMKESTRLWIVTALPNSVPGGCKLHLGNPLRSTFAFALVLHSSSDYSQ